MTRDRTAIVAAIPVAAVAVLAAIQSYSHIEGLALAQHQSLADARMLPFSVDFLIVAGSVILLAGSWLGWLCVVPGVVATLLANVVSGLRYGPLAAIVAGWPAVAFSLASFALERWLKSQVTRPSNVADLPQSESTGSDHPEPAVPAVSNGHSAGWAAAPASSW